VASGADAILIPEIPYDIDKVCDLVSTRSKRGRRCSIICVSEGAKPKGGQQVVARVDPTSPDPIRLGGVGQVIAGQIESATKIETRVTVLGHVQRGGTPAAQDRVLATLFGHAAIDLLMAGGKNRLVVMQQGRVTSIGLTEASDKQRLVPPDDPLLLAARDLKVCFGD
jgi:6-phosphofructokinase 1